MRSERKQMSDAGHTFDGVRNTRHMAEPGTLVASFVLDRDFYVAEIQVLLRRALTRVLCDTGGGLAFSDHFVGAAKVLRRVTKGSPGNWPVRPAQGKERR